MWSIRDRNDKPTNCAVGILRGVMDADHPNAKNGARTRPYALLGFAVGDPRRVSASSPNRFTLTLVDGGRYTLRLWRCDGTTFFATVAIAVPQRPPLFITMHPRRGICYDTQCLLTRLVGFEWVRIELYWRDAEPAPDQWCWLAGAPERSRRVWEGVLDAIHRADAYGLKCYINLGVQNPPPWLRRQRSTREEQCAHERAFIAGDRERPGALAALNGIAKDTIIAWQPFNEPGSPGAGAKALHPFQSYTALLELVRGAAAPHQEIVLNPNATHGNFWALRDASAGERAGLRSAWRPLSGWLQNGKSAAGRCDRLALHDALTVTAVDLYPDSWAIRLLDRLCNRGHVQRAVERARRVAALNPGRECWVVEMPASDCTLAPERVAELIECAMSSGASAIGLYQLAEQQRYRLGALFSPGAYGLLDQNGRLYADYYRALRRITGVQYDGTAPADRDPGCHPRMIPWEGV